MSAGASLIGNVKVDGDLIKDGLNGVGEMALKLRQAVTGDISPEDKAEIEKLTAEIEGRIQLAQAETNKIDAQSPRLFNSGWRPAIGWICCVGFAQYYIVNPWMIWVFGLLNKTATAPTMDIGDLLSLVLALLGFGGLRTFERSRGIARI